VVRGVRQIGGCCKDTNMYDLKCFKLVQSSVGELELRVYSLFYLATSFCC